MNEAASLKLSNKSTCINHPWWKPWRSVREARYQIPWRWSRMNR